HPRFSPYIPSRRPTVGTTVCNVVLILSTCGDHPDLHSFPTRRSSDLGRLTLHDQRAQQPGAGARQLVIGHSLCHSPQLADQHVRSEEHTSELQSRGHLVCRLLLEKKKQSRRTSTRSATTCALLNCASR